TRPEPLEHLEKLWPRELASSRGQPSEVPVAERLLDRLDRRRGRACWLFDHRNHSLSEGVGPGSSGASRGLRRKIIDDATSTFCAVRGRFVVGDTRLELMTSS